MREDEIQLEEEVKERIKKEFVEEDNFKSEVDEELEYLSANWK